MRVYFIKDFLNEDGRVFKRGSSEILWDATEAIKGGYAVPYELRYEPQAKAQTKPKGGRKAAT